MKYLRFNTTSTIEPKIYDVPKFDNTFGTYCSYYNYSEGNKCATRNATEEDGWTAVFASEFLP
jgi:hypothetical protein